MLKNHQPNVPMKDKNKLLVLEYTGLSLKQLNSPLSREDEERMKKLREELLLSHDEIVNLGKDLLVAQ